MRTKRSLIALVALGFTLSLSGGPRRSAGSEAGEWQLTFSPVSHLLDNNDNFSKDSRYLVFDTRDTVGSGIGNGTSIMKVDVMTGEEKVIYAPEAITGTNAAPGLGAASFSPVADEVVFIHGPLVSEVPTLGYYGRTNRRGAVVPADGSGTVKWLDYRDVTSAVTPPGAHRGGSHRHEYSLDGKRVGFTYDDQLLTTYGRTLGFMMPHANAPGGATHWTALLVPIVPAGTAKPGELENAADDSWIGAKGLMRGFIGKVREQDGSYTNSLFVVDVPEDVDITTSDSGTTERYMAPPMGTTIRRLTHTAASGIVRGSHDGERAAYYATAEDGTRQVFIIRSTGSDTDPDPAMRPIQATFLEQGASGGVRWHPSGNSIAELSDNGVVVTCVKPGPLFGVSYFLTPRGSKVPAADALVWSRNGQRLAYNRRVPTYNAQGELVKDFGNNDFRQIFLVNFPDDNNNGIADPIENGVVRNAASFRENSVAPEAFASIFGENLAAAYEAAGSLPLPTTLGGVSVELTDSSGAKFAAPLQMVDPSQVNFVVPAGLKTGRGAIAVRSEGRTATIPMDVETVAPGLFAANADGKGVAAAVALWIAADGTQTSRLTAECAAGICSPAPLDLGPESGRMILLLFGTGLRGASKATAKIGGQTAEVLGLAAQSEYPGLDQVNVVVPRELAGKGVVPVEIVVDGRKANTVTVNIR